MPSLPYLNIVFEAPDPEGLSLFYAGLLGLETLRRPPDWVMVGHDGVRPRLAFDRAKEHRPPRWPDPEHPQQVHLHLTVPDRAATEAWLATHGAARLPDLGSDRPVWADPAGHLLPGRGSVAWTPDHRGRTGQRRPLRSGGLLRPPARPRPRSRPRSPRGQARRRPDHDRR